MAATDAKPFPIKGAAFRLYYFLRLSTSGDLVLGGTTPNAIVSKDGGAFVGSTNAVVESPAAGGSYYVDLTAAEMNADHVAVRVWSATAGTQVAIHDLYPQEAGDIKVDVQSFAGMRTGTLAAGGTTTIQFEASASAATDFYKNQIVYLTGGTGAGQARAITNYNGGLKVASVTPAWATSPDATTTYALLPFDPAVMLTAVAGVQADTDNLQLRIPAALGTGSRMDCNAVFINGSALNANALATDAVTEIQTGLATAAAIATLQAAVTDLQARLPATLSSGNIRSDAQAIGGSTEAAGRLQRSAETLCYGVVGVGSTTASIVTSALSPPAVVPNQFKGRVLLFARDTSTAALRGQATEITASTAGGVLTVAALTTVPASGDTFTIA